MSIRDLQQTPLLQTAVLGIVLEMYLNLWICLYWRNWP